MSCQGIQSVLKDLRKSTMLLTRLLTFSLSSVLLIPSHFNFHKIYSSSNTRKTQKRVERPLKATNTVWITMFRFSAKHLTSVDGSPNSLIMIHGNSLATKRH